MKSFLTGLGVGAVLGCAFAPEAGRETRKRLRSMAQGLAQPSASQPTSPEAETREEAHPFVGSSAQSQGNDSNEIQSAEKTQSSTKDEVTQVLNTASKTTLRTVRGIGDATARRIVEHRPYESEEGILKDKVLSKETLENLKETLVEKDEKVA